MADDITNLKSVGVVVGAGVSATLALTAGVWTVEAYRSGRLQRGWRWLRVQALGGVTTLKQNLSYKCTICFHSLEAHEKVRKLSCGHVFHCGGTEKCKESIDKWLCETNMTCPVCRVTPRPVMPWDARPPLSSPAAPSSASASGSSSEQLPLASAVLED